LLNLAILGMVIAAAVYIFQIGNGNRSVKCTALDKFGDTCTGLDVSPVGGCAGLTNLSSCDTAYQTVEGTSNQCMVSSTKSCILGSTCNPP